MNAELEKIMKKKFQFLLSWIVLFIVLYFKFSLTFHFDLNNSLILPFLSIMILSVGVAFFIKKKRFEFAAEDPAKLGAYYLISWATINSCWVLSFVLCQAQQTSVPYLYISLPFLVLYLLCFNFNAEEDIEEMSKINSLREK